MAIPFNLIHIGLIFATSSGVGKEAQGHDAPNTKVGGRVSFDRGSINIRHIFFLMFYGFRAQTNHRQILGAHAPSLPYSCRLRYFSLKMFLS